jgi:hypothetical protein
MKEYVQCRLRRGTECTTAWIEDRGAIVGAEVVLLATGLLWEVVEVALRPKLREDQLKEHQMLNRRSLPSIEAMR